MVSELQQLQQQQKPDIFSGLRNFNVPGYRKGFWDGLRIGIFLGFVCAIVILT